MDGRITTIADGALSRAGARLMCDGRHVRAEGQNR